MSFRSEAESFWQTYFTVAHPRKAIRLGVRYVNQIDVPTDYIEITDYLRTAISISPFLPQGLSSYFLQATIPLPMFDAEATVTSTFVPPRIPGGVSLVLDIDCWRPVDFVFEPGRNGLEAIRDGLDILRDAKNFVFEACITDATRGLIS